MVVNNSSSHDSTKTGWPEAIEARVWMWSCLSVPIQTLTQTQQYYHYLAAHIHHYIRSLQNANRTHVILFVSANKTLTQTQQYYHCLAAHIHHYILSLQNANRTHVILFVSANKTLTQTQQYYHYQAAHIHNYILSLQNAPPNIIRWSLPNVSIKSWLVTDQSKFKPKFWSVIVSALRQYTGRWIWVMADFTFCQEGGGCKLQVRTPEIWGLLAQKT